MKRLPALVKKRFRTLIDNTTSTATQHNEGACGEDDVEHFWVNPIRSITTTDTTIGTARAAKDGEISITI